MVKWHVNGKGVPAICRATKGNCPFGTQDSHYESQEKAQIAADKAGESKHGLLQYVAKEKTTPGEEKFLRVEKEVIRENKVIKTNAETVSRRPYSLSNFVKKGGSDYFTNITENADMDGESLVKSLNEDKNIYGKWSLKSQDEFKIELQSKDVFGNTQSVAVRLMGPPKPRVRNSGEYQAYTGAGINSAISNYVSYGDGGTAEARSYFEGLIKNANGSPQKLVKTLNADKRVYGNTWTIKEESETEFTLGHTDTWGNKSTLNIYK